jgi:hypothetical protein
LSGEGRKRVQDPLMTKHYLALESQIREAWQFNAPRNADSWTERSLRDVEHNFPKTSAEWYLAGG